MDERLKTGLLSAVVVALVVVAAIIGFRTLKGKSEPTISADYLRMPPDQRQKVVDDMERKRRAVGKPALLHLPEDPPGFPPPGGQRAASASGRRAYTRPTGYTRPMR